MSHRLRYSRVHNAISTTGHCPVVILSLFCILLRGRSSIIFGPLSSSGLRRRHRIAAGCCAVQPHRAPPHALQRALIVAACAAANAATIAAVTAAAALLGVTAVAGDAPAGAAAPAGGGAAAPEAGRPGPHARAPEGPAGTRDRRRTGGCARRAAFAVAADRCLRAVAVARPYGSRHAWLVWQRDASPGGFHFDADPLDDTLWQHTCSVSSNGASRVDNTAVPAMNAPSRPFPPRNLTSGSYHFLNCSLLSNLSRNRHQLSARNSARPPVKLMSGDPQVCGTPILGCALLQQTRLELRLLSLQPVSAPSVLLGAWPCCPSGAAARQSRHAREEVLPRQ